MVVGAPTANGLRSNEQMNNEQSPPPPPPPREHTSHDAADVPVRTKKKPWSKPTMWTMTGIVDIASGGTVMAVENANYRTS